MTHQYMELKIEELEKRIEALEQEPNGIFDEYGNYKYPSDVELTEPNTATSMPSGDLISRQAVIDAIDKRIKNMGVLIALPTNKVTPLFYSIHNLPSVNPQEPKIRQFADWVATEIFDENWEYNKDAFEELACRKLEKLGIVRAKGDEWELVEQEEERDRQ